MKSKHIESKSSVFHLQDGATIIRSISTERRQSLRQLSIHAKIHPSYLSRVLAGGAILSLEQAFRIANVLQFNTAEREYFFLVVQFQASSDRAHRAYLQAKMAEFRVEQDRLENMLADKKSSNISLKIEQDSASYYQQVLTAKVHMHLLLPRYREKPESIAHALNISTTTLAHEIRRLEHLGIVTREAERIVDVKEFMHLDSAHPASIQNHINWRLDAIQRITTREHQNNDYNFSAAFTANEFVREAIKSAFKAFIVQVEEFVRNANGNDDLVLKIGFDLY